MSYHRRYKLKDGCFGLLALSLREKVGLMLWKVNVEDGEENFRKLQGHSTFVWSVVFSPDGSLLASGDNDGEIKLWEVKSGHCLKTLRGGPVP